MINDTIDTDEYDIRVDTDQECKAAEIRLCRLSRPHMRAFHAAWISHFMAFFTWFSIAPLLGEIEISLSLTREQIWTSSIGAVSSAVFMRFLLGPMCDKYGARRVMAAVLCMASIPAACTGFVFNATSLLVLRIFIGTAGSTIVMAQFWTTSMFTKEIVGTANGLVGGWGNVGGGVAQLVIGSVLFPLFKSLFGGDTELAWRTVCIVPAIASFTTGLAIMKLSDDCPTGDYKDLKRCGDKVELSALRALRSGALDFNTWILFLQYGASLGVALTMTNEAALYFRDEFDMTTEVAAAIASIFGFTNIFARPLGGYLSDKCNERLGLRGRLAWQTFCLFIESVLILMFSRTKSVVNATVVMTFMSIFTNAAAGSTFGIVPYINSAVTGSVSGVVGSGGSAGALVYGVGFRQLSRGIAYTFMGASVMTISLLSLFVFIKGDTGLFLGTEYCHIVSEKMFLIVSSPHRLWRKRFPAKGDFPFAADTTHTTNEKAIV